MFRVPSNNVGRLVCMICRMSIDLPKHHDRDMKWILEGNFVKREYLVCSVCNHKIEVPTHCNEPMLYRESDYDDVSI